MQEKFIGKYVLMLGCFINIKLELNATYKLLHIILFLIGNRKTVEFLLLKCLFTI